MVTYFLIPKDFVENNSTEFEHINRVNGSTFQQSASNLDFAREELDAQLSLGISTSEHNVFHGYGLKWFTQRYCRSVGLIGNAMMRTLDVRKSRRRIAIFNLNG
ncbi:uncharacterized protein EAF02_004576 [Botrytis sinoallii]|uniref:uncharacterized protein n=1 Tax=Botrytis sinoallii TaxID=1463999 RepID=UPI0018FF50D0|nr:uncharacterized protein EAF02_004576 [Botrytis sinoallii]KAF7884240.1 hypothetical protein EAF02_004576 [Botrytis sinoallii]